MKFIRMSALTNNCLSGCRLLQITVCPDASAHKYLFIRMPELTNICLSGCKSSQIFVYLNVNAQNSRSNNCSSGRWHKKLILCLWMRVHAHKCLLILDGDLAKFCLSGCRYAFSRFFAAHKYITENPGSL
jgi:hypothetical protein